MEWKDIAEAVGKAAPVLGSLLLGKAGEAAGTLIAATLGVGNTPSEVSEALAVNPDAAVKLAQIEADQKVKLQEILFTSEVANTQSVNTTMREEAASQHWPTYSWRPAIGFSVAITLLIATLTVAFSYLGVMYFAAPVESLTHLPGMLMSLTALIGIATPILGIASYFRGKMQADPSIPTDNRG